MASKEYNNLQTVGFPNLYCMYQFTGGELFQTSSIYVLGHSEGADKHTCHSPAPQLGLDSTAAFCRSSTSTPVDVVCAGDM